MPIYEYKLVDGKCAICPGMFEIRRPLTRPELTHCPRCKKPVCKVISSVNTPSLTKPLSISDAKKVGFTILEKKDKGIYERL